MEMEDIAMKHLYPEAYESIANALNAKKAERNAAIDRVISDVRESLEDLHIKYEIYGRSKHFYSIFKKMQYQKLPLHFSKKESLLRTLLLSQRISHCP
jgi:GTP pyrophosphokinase